MDKLPSTHKAKWFAGATLNSADQAMASMFSTAMSRLNAFLDREMEQILCFDISLDMETFCKEKSAIFIVLPEEDNTKYFMVLLFLQQLYREMVTIADEHCEKLPNCVMMFVDEIGTILKIESMEMMVSARRSRRISMVPIIQSFVQLEKTMERKALVSSSITVRTFCLADLHRTRKVWRFYRKRLETELFCQAPSPEASQSLQMMSRPLMSPDELKTLPKGHFILAKTGNCPMQIQLPLFLKWGIQCGDVYEVPEQPAKTVKYEDCFELEQEVVQRRDAEDGEWEEPPISDTDETRKGGQQQSQVQTLREHSSTSRRPPLRTDQEVIYIWGIFLTSTKRNCPIVPKTCTCI